jgi:hypothetical protein
MANSWKPENRIDPTYGDPNYLKVEELLKKHHGINEEFLAELKTYRDEVMKKENDYLAQVRKQHMRKKHQYKHKKARRNSPLTKEKA